MFKAVVYVTWHEDGEGMAGDPETKWDVERVRTDCEVRRWDRLAVRQRQWCGLGILVSG